MTISEFSSDYIHLSVEEKLDYLKDMLVSLRHKDQDLNCVVSFVNDSQVSDQLNYAKNKQHKIATIPTLLKDNFNMLGTKTTASSNILKDYISPYDATVTSRLKENGAIILGKTNLDAFAHGSTTETSDFGVTKNPYDRSRVAGGSSGGAAAAVAAGFVPYAIGSETAGSVRGPAAWCGVYGFAPSYGRISRYGLIAMGSSLDRPGILANSVSDIAYVTDAIAGHDKYDATSKSLKNTNYSEKLSKRDVSKLKIGLPRQFFDDRINSEILTRTMEVASQFERAGASIVEMDLLDPKYSMAVYTIVCRSEVSSNLARIDGIRYGHVSDQKAESILDQIALNRGEGFGNEAIQRSMTGAYALSAGYYDAYYKKAQKVRRLIVEDFEKQFSEVDVILAPTMPMVAPKIGEMTSNPLSGELADLLNESSALAGLPCISMPAGKNKKNMPIGVQMFAPQNQEQLILDLAYLFEQEVNI